MSAFGIFPVSLLSVQAAVAVICWGAAYMKGYGSGLTKRGLCWTILAILVFLSTGALRALGGPYTLYTIVVMSGFHWAIGRLVGSWNIGQVSRKFVKALKEQLLAQKLSERLFHELVQIPEIGPDKAQELASTLAQQVADKLGPDVIQGFQQELKDKPVQ